MSEKLVYGGYVNFPLPPKDIKGIEKLRDQYTTFDDLFSLINGLCEESWGFKVEHDLRDNVWKVVIYNLLPLREGDGHAYYISGESDTLIKAFCVVRYKADALSGQDLSTWVSNKPKGEFR
jgi:hypothetical protein